MATDFTYGGKQIVIGGPIKPNGKDMPSDARTRVDCYADIATIPNPYVGLRITVKVDETNNNKMTDYIVKSLKANSMGVANSVVDEVVRYVDYLGINGQSVDTNNFATKEELGLKADKTELHSHINKTVLDGIASTNVDNWNNKVDKVEGKTLTTNDYTNEEKQTVASLKATVGDTSSGLVKDVKDLKTNGVSQDNINVAIENYLTEHPVSGGATAEQVAQIEANRVAIGDENSGLTKEVNDIKNTELQNLNTAILRVNETVGNKSELPVGDENIIASINRIDGKTTTGNGLTSEQVQQLQTAYEHSQSDHVTMDEVNVAIANAQLGGGEVDTTSFATDLSLTGSNLQLKNSQGNLIGNAVTLPLISSTTTAFLNDKKYCAVGDSITLGVNTTKKYHEYLKEYFNLKAVTNLGMDGSTITSKSRGICDRIANIPKDSDLITLFAGTNDFFYAMPIGEWYTTDSSNKRTLTKDKTTFRGALNVICEYLIDNFSNKLIYLMTPIHRYTFMTQPTDLEPNSKGLYLEEYVNCIIECGKIHSLPVIDLYSKSGLLPSNTNNANLYFNPTSDYLHPNATGHKKIAQVIYKEIVNDMFVGSDYTPVVKTLSRISATYNQGSTTVYPSTSLDTLKTNLIVKAIYSDNSEDVVTTYNLSGTLSVGTSQITVTYSDKTTTFNVIVSEEQVASKTLSSISAVYTQNSTIVYPTTSLDSLKDNLVVTATYSDGSTSTVTDYNLSGTLSVGTSQITVTYSDKTTTFDVNVTESTNTYRAVTRGDLTLINSTLTIDETGYKITSTTQWNGVRLTNVPKESKVTLLQTNLGQCIWYMYKYDSEYMYVLSIGSGNNEHGKAYKLVINSSNAVQNGKVSMTMIPTVGDVLKVVVNGSTQTLYCNDSELCTLTDCNTVGISNQKVNSNYLTSKWEVLY